MTAPGDPVSPAVRVSVEREGGVLLAVAWDGQGRPVALFPDRVDRPDPAGAILRGRVARRFDGGSAEITVPAEISPDGRVRVDRLPKGPKPGDPVTLEIATAPPAPKRPAATVLPTLVGRAVAYQPLAPVGIALSKRLRGAGGEALVQALPRPTRGGLVIRQAALDLPVEAVAAEAEGLIAAAAPIFDAGGDPAVLLPAPPIWRRLATAVPTIADLAQGGDGGTTGPWARLPLPGLTRASGPPAPADGLDWLDAYLSPTVALPGGGRLTVERTAALTAIDVDTGDGSTAAVNRAAADRIAREIRLRNLSGIVVVDFAGHAGGEAAAALIDRVTAGLAGDPATVTPGRRFSPLGLWECARQRRAPSLDEVF